MKNLKEFKALIIRYESITIEEIENALKDVDDIIDAAKALTGFGYEDTCSLCLAVEMDCKECVYGSDSVCTLGENERTYDNICFAITSQELKKAYKARAKHMRSLINKTK